jgi:hypothetical protein
MVTREPGLVARTALSAILGAPLFKRLFMNAGYKPALPGWRHYGGHGGPPYYGPS